MNITHRDRHLRRRCRDACGDILLNTIAGIVLLTMVMTFAVDLIYKHQEVDARTYAWNVANEIAQSYLVLGSAVDCARFFADPGIGEDNGDPTTTPTIPPEDLELHSRCVPSALQVLAGEPITVSDPAQNIGDSDAQEFTIDDFDVRIVDYYRIADGTYGCGEAMDDTEPTRYEWVPLVTMRSVTVTWRLGDMKVEATGIGKRIDDLVSRTIHDPNEADGTLEQFSKLRTSHPHESKIRGRAGSGLPLGGETLAGDPWPIPRIGECQIAVLQL